MAPPRKEASSQVSWSLLTEGVTQARLEAHRLRLLVDRAMALVQTSPARDHLWQVGGDLIQGFPERLSNLERVLDRTNYALVVMGEDFLRGRISIDDRYVVDEATRTHPYSGPRTKVQESAARVAGRYMQLRFEGVAPSGEHHFFDTPKKREVREFAEAGALSNIPAVAGASVEDMANADVSVAKARSEARKAPPTPAEIVRGPGGGQFSTLNRQVLETEQPKTKGTL